MPELPDITVYVERLRAYAVGATVDRLRLLSPFVLRTVEPPVTAASGRTVKAVSSIGKRIVIELEGELFIVVHLMIAGRLRWREPGPLAANKLALAQFELSTGTVLLTEASPKKRASIHLIQGREGLAEHDRGGIDVFAAADAAIAAALRRDNHTVKRALTDPTVLSGIGNAYSDEILHHARLSPFKQTQKLSDDEMAMLIVSMRAVLREWTDRLRAEVGEGFPDKVTAFHDAMAVHGRYGKPCPRCGATVQRIRYADNEANYCAKCQNAGKLLADRSLSQLLKKDWPKTLDDLETLKRDARAKAGN
ncbi:MAG: Fpg/Nei family DNA glycosylase [Myxococcota bacterium]|nr:DNA-formamidopyrimidine glycosylase family protein [Myxococcota bacterium]